MAEIVKKIRHRLAWLRHRQVLNGLRRRVQLFCHTANRIALPAPPPPLGLSPPEVEREKKTEGEKIQLHKTCNQCFGPKIRVDQPIIDQFCTTLAEFASGKEGNSLPSSQRQRQRQRQDVGAEEAIKVYRWRGAAGKKKVPSG